MSDRSSVVSATIVSVLVTLILCVLIVLIFMIKTDLNPNIADFAKVLGGAIVAKFGTVVDYWLGSSAGSRNKDDTISNITQR